MVLNQSINRLIPIVIKSCIKDKKFNCSSGIQKRDFLYVDDFISLINKLIISKKKLKEYIMLDQENLQVLERLLNLYDKKLKKENQILAR